MNASAAQYQNEGQQRVLATLALLATALGPMRLEEVCQQLGGNKATTLRDLENLALAGFVERDGTCWRPGPALLDIGKRLAKRRIENILLSL